MTSGIKFLLSSALFFAISGAALAKPVYLTCDFMRDGQPQPRKFTLDEDRGTAVMYWPETAESLTLSAQFTDTIVLFEIYTERYGINRTSLVGVRQAKIDDSIEQAQCRIETPTNRAF